MLIWAEPFEQYGRNAGLIAPFGYTDVSYGGFATGRTGPDALNFNNGSNILRRALNTPQTTIGQGAGIMQVATGTANAFNTGLRWESAGKTFELCVNVRPDLSIGVWDRTGTLKGASNPNAVTINSYSWVEAKAIGNTAGAGTGSVEVRVQGNTVCTVNGIDLPNAFAFINWGQNTNGCGTMNIDDWVAWDTTGTKNNDFLGDRRLFLSYPDANLATQDFTPSAGNAWDCVNNAPPVDTTYIDGAAAGNISEFAKDAIGVQSNDIAALVVIGRLFKTDAGTATGKLGINSNGFVSNSADINPGTTGAWSQFFQELDPNGNIAWTRAAADAAALRITRTA